MAVTSKDGQKAKARIRYTVAAAPSVSFVAPKDGARYTRDQLVKASYRCREGEDGPGIRACKGTLAVGEAIDTRTLGAHTFSVTATSRDGQSTTDKVTYRVVGR